MKILSEDIVKIQYAANFSADISAGIAAGIYWVKGAENVRVVKAPGRVNLIGEHTDYNGGFVLPIAINYYTYIAFTPRADRQLHIIAKDFNNASVVINLDEPMQRDHYNSWSNYIRGVVQELLQKKYILAGGNLFITGNVPIGAGLSSSASLEIATIRALIELSNETITPSEAALAGQAAENNFVGCKCGIMDQLISALGQDSSALLIDCENLVTRSVAIPADWELLIVHSGVKRGLVDSEYNQRRLQCEAAATYFGKATLRDISVEQLFAAEAELDPLTFRRARHVLTENARTILAADALTTRDMSTLAKAMQESHSSMRDDFNITTPSIDALVNILTVAGDGYAGVRMTGGGFGGCVVAIAPTTIIPQLTAAVEQHYEVDTGCIATLFPAKAVAGAFANGAETLQPSKFF
ncbi:MAG: galactokinase [Pseudomonadota bacterium]